MSSNNNFLLKIHMEEEGSTKEIFLNKERRSFTFVNDECVSDLVMPEFKITSLNMILKNTSETSGEDTYYAEYEKDDELIREYDKDKIDLLVNMITTITINEFLDYQDKIKVNDYYVDNIVDAYNCVLPIEVKRLISYTTNGVAFSGVDNLYMLPHDDIVEYKGETKDFIPIIHKNNTNYFGYDFKESVYKEYSKDKKVNEAKTLKKLIQTSQIELLDLDEEEPKEEIHEEEFEVELIETPEEEFEVELIDAPEEEFEVELIDTPEEEFEVELIDTPEEEFEVELIDTPEEEFEVELIETPEEKFEVELIESVEKTLEEINKEYDETLRNIDYQLERLNNGLHLKDVEEPKIADKKSKKKEAKEKEIKEKIREDIKKNIEEIEKTNSLIDEIDSNIDKVPVKKNNIKIKKEKQKETKKEKEVIKTPKIKEIKEVKIETKKETDNEKLREFLKEYDKQQIEQLRELKAQQEREEEQKRLEKAGKKEEARLKALEEQREITSLNELITTSINNGLNNYKVNFNDTQKLVVEHLPYYEMPSEFDVIQIPEIEIDKITLLPSCEIDLGKIKLLVNKLNSNKVDLLVQSASMITDKDNNKLKVGAHLELDLNTEIALRLNKKGVMETWTLRMEKSTFLKELRNIDYGKVMNNIIKLEGYKKLGNIEKYELQKSVMLFIDFVMRYNEFNELEELYRILKEEPTLYEEYITKYNVRHSLELKDSLATYDSKKEFVNKLNYVNGLIDAKWLDYPRYIFGTHNYFMYDEVLQDFIDDLNDSLKEEDFADYLKKLFKEYEVFVGLDSEGEYNLNKCLEYLSVLYKYNPYLGEYYKYQIEKTFMIGATEEDISLLISKLCRRGIKDYSIFVEYDAMMKNKYRLGELQYPIFSESFGIEEIRNGGEYDEY